MKEVIFVRHAKSDWENGSLNDVDRFLNERGYSSAYAMSDWFHKNKNLPDGIVSSTATRALSTALIFARRLNFNLKKFVLEPGIYESGADNLLDIIQNQDNSAKSIMLFGHNPGFTEMCNRLSPQVIFDNLPTCGLVCFSFETDNWQQIEFKKGKLSYMQFPKDLIN